MLGMAREHEPEALLRERGVATGQRLFGELHFHATAQRARQCAQFQRVARGIAGLIHPRGQPQRGRGQQPARAGALGVVEHGPVARGLQQEAGRAVEIGLDQAFARLCFQPFGAHVVQ